MIPMDIPVNAALNVGTPASAQAQPGPSAAAASISKLPGRTGAGDCRGASFHDELREVHDQIRAAEEAKDLFPASSPYNPCCEGPGALQPVADKISKEQELQADDSRCWPGNSQDIRSQLSTLIQVLQGISTALQTVETISETGADENVVEPPEDDAAGALSQLLDILKQLQDSPVDAAQSSSVFSRISELCDQVKSMANATPADGRPGKIHQLLQDLREHLSGIAWERTIQEVAPGSPVADAGPEKDAASTAAMTEVREDSHGTAQNHPGSSLQAIIRKFPAELGPVVRDHQPMAVENREVTTAGPASEEGKFQGGEREHPARVSSPLTVPAVHSAEGGRGLDPAQSADAKAAPSGPLRGVCEDPQTPMEGDRQPAGDRLIAKTIAEADAATPENQEPAAAFEMDPAAPRPLHLHDGSPEKAADAVGAGREKEPAAAGRAGVFDQIVQRAVVQIKAGQSEIKIDLKPDFLGHVRMQIVSENQQVSVRILTELPAVRDMIETGLQQLRSELQNQGLHVDRLEVAVSDDPRQSPRRQARPDEWPKPVGVVSVVGTEASAANRRSDPVYYLRRAGRTAAIDMFV